MEREIKFRAWDGTQMLFMPLVNNFGLHRFFGMLSNDTPIDQYTGLKDSKGVEIYENDIVKTEWGNPEDATDYVFEHSVITFTNGQFLEGETPIGQTYDACTIIGNVHQHSHLLNK